jgi:hypothetical protein
LIGVNTNTPEAKKLKGTMDKEKLNWRSFVIQGAINAKWNEPGTPMYYVIDHKGVIRYKWFGSPGERAIDRALEKLIEEAEGNGRDTPQ